MAPVTRFWRTVGWAESGQPNCGIVQLLITVAEESAMITLAEMEEHLVEALRALPPQRCGPCRHVGGPTS